MIHHWCFKGSYSTWCNSYIIERTRVTITQPGVYDTLVRVSVVQVTVMNPMRMRALNCYPLYDRAQTLISQRERCVYYTSLWTLLHVRPGSPRALNCNYKPSLADVGVNSTDGACSPFICTKAPHDSGAEGLYHSYTCLSSPSCSSWRQIIAN